MNNFIRKYLDYTKEYESPTSFFFWSGVATIAATLRDNFYIQIGGDSKIFANMYVLFVAESGAYRKGKPVEISNKLVADVNNTKIISGRGSIQAILEELAHSETDKITGKMIKGGSAIFYAPELSAGIVEDPAAIKILTDIYDSRENYKSLLKSGSTRIENMVFSMLAASNEALLKETYNSQAIQGGLLARTFLVVPDEFRKSNALLDKKSNKEEYKELIRILTEISQLSGSAFIPEDAKKEYIHWYESFRTGYQNKRDAAGVVSRIHTGVLKVALCYAAGDLSQQITKTHMEEAINDCIALLPNYGNFVMSNRTGKLASAGTTLLKELFEAPGFSRTRSEILRKYWAEIDGILLDEVVSTLQQAKLVETTLGGNSISYKLTPACIETLKTGA